MAKRLVETGENEIVVLVDAEPSQVGIDPYNKLIDRNPDDNLKSIGESWGERRGERRGGVVSYVILGRVRVLAGRGRCDLYCYRIYSRC